MRKKIENEHGFDLWQIDGSANSSVPYRYVVHFMDIPGPGYQGPDLTYGNHIEHAKNMLHGTKYRAKWFGGGIVFQAYAGDPIKHVQAAIRRAETGEDFITAYNNI